MRALDRLLQRWRIHQAGRWIPAGARLLDVGCADGALFRQLGDRVAEGVGLDPNLAEAKRLGATALLPGRFPADSPEGPFDVITLLAVVEHLEPEPLREAAARCATLLAPQGRVIVTVPERAVDHLLALLKGLRLIDGMSLEEHHGFAASKTAGVFAAAGLVLEHHSRFELGLNNLFVFRAPRAEAGAR
jgi:2-polyprenyl-3-methyl-5-hydroxy-6-metoxy-1,4-benzoquinol methylase